MPHFRIYLQSMQLHLDRLVISQNSQVNCPLCQGDVEKLHVDLRDSESGLGQLKPRRLSAPCARVAAKSIDS